MYQDTENNFEKFPGGSSSELSGEQAAKAGEWEAAMSDDVPEFSGEQFGNQPSGDEIENTDEYDAGLADAAALINYGLNAAARNLGVETVIQKIKTFDATGSSNPIGDLYKHLGLDAPGDRKDLRNEAIAAAPSEIEMRESINAPTEKRSYEGAFQAIDDMKELILEVEGADPKYDELRQGARAAGKGYFEYAVSSFGTQGLVELFKVLGEQGKKAESEPEFTEETSEQEDDLEDKTEK